MPRWSVLPLCLKNPLQDRKDSSPLLGEWCGGLLVLPPTTPPPLSKGVNSLFAPHFQVKSNIFSLHAENHTPSKIAWSLPISVSHPLTSLPMLSICTLRIFPLNTSLISSTYTLNSSFFTWKTTLVIYYFKKKWHPSCPSMLVGFLYVMRLHFFMVVTIVFSFSFLIGGASYGKWYPHIFSFHYSAIFYPKKKH